MDTKAWTVWPDMDQLWGAILAPEVLKGLAKALLCLHHRLFPLSNTTCFLSLPQMLILNNSLCAKLSQHLPVGNTTCNMKQGSFPASQPYMPSTAVTSLYSRGAQMGKGCNTCWDHNVVDYKVTEKWRRRFLSSSSLYFLTLCSEEDVKVCSLQQRPRGENIWERQHTALLFGDL